MAAIACLGWGSLIWDPRTLPIRERWFSDGPLLPIEFARTSSKSTDKRITLVILPEAPLVRTLWCLLTSNAIDEAKQALVDREGITGASKLDKIGFWTAKEKSKHVSVDAVGHWALSNQLNGVVWTELEPTFAKQFNREMIEAVLTHLRGLNYVEGKYAEEYVCRAPRQIDTECRRAIEGEFGWSPVE